MESIPLPAWAAAIRKETRPVYAAIVDAIAAAVHDGRLAPGDRLPPQRLLAKGLGLNLTTVTHAYGEAAGRRLVEARVGQGTFVARGQPQRAPPSRGAADMSMNLPPLFDDPTLVRRMWAAVGTVERLGGLPLWLGYQEAGGTQADRATGTRWLREWLPEVVEDRVLVCPGVQGALLALTSLLARPGDTVCTEALAYPGFRALAAHLGLRIVGLAMDAEGLLPDAFDAACRAHAPKALYCTPTLNNPTTATMSLKRREAVVAVARRHGVVIVEDDAYGRLPADAAPPLAALAPELTWYVGGLAKVMSPALRIAYLAAPDARGAGRAAAALRATVGMASPLTAAIASRWIEDGTDQAILTALRRGNEARFARAYCGKSSTVTIMSAAPTHSTSGCLCPTAGRAAPSPPGSARAASAR